jgi:RND family efflux transporter MFP subunit
MNDEIQKEPLDDNETELYEAHPPRSGWLGRIVKIFLCLLVLSAGIAGASYINKTAPKPGKRPPQKTAPLVRTQVVQPSTEQITVYAMGTVIPARQIVLKSRVSGEIISVHPEFTEGGFLKKGDKVLQIDPEDYRLAIEQKKSQVADAEYAFKLELGRQDVAKREWELLNSERPNKEKDAELALRKPHLDKAKADLVAAKAELRQAQLALSRTTVLSPFNAVIREKNVDLGSQVSAQDQLAELVGTDEYWIQASVSLDRLKWITVPAKDDEYGSRVRIRFGNGFQTAYELTGRVVRLLSDLETDGRMARLLVAVKDPLGLKKKKNHQPPLLIGDFVHVEIQGVQLKDVYCIPRIALRDNSNIWIVQDDEVLRIRRADIIWRDIDTVLLKEGLSSNENLIISDIQSPVDGMRVRIEQTNSNVPAGKDLKKRERT